MKTSLLTSTAAQGLQPLKWNAFSVSPGLNFGPLAAAFTPNQVQCLQTNSGNYGSFDLRFLQTAGGKIMAWVQPGTAVKIAASVTTGGKDYDLSGYYVVSAIDPNGTWFQVHQKLVNTAFAATNVDNGSGKVTAPLVSLVMQAQKVMFSASISTVMVAPVVDANGNAPYSFPVAPSSDPNTPNEYEVVAPLGAKFDLADWQAKTTSGGVLSVRFV